MRIKSSGTYRDGGTAYVVLDKGNKREVEYQIDFSLPHDGRVRKVGRVFRNGNVSEYEIGSEQENKICLLVRSLAQEHLGEEAVLEYISGSKSMEYDEVWSGVISFIKICVEEGKYA